MPWGDITNKSCYSDAVAVEPGDAVPPGTKKSNKRHQAVELPWADLSEKKSEYMLRISPFKTNAKTNTSNVKFGVVNAVWQTTDADKEIITKHKPIPRKDAPRSLTKDVIINAIGGLFHFRETGTENTTQIEMKKTAPTKKIKLQCNICVAYDQKKMRHNIPVFIKKHIYFHKGQSLLHVHEQLKYKDYKLFQEDVTYTAKSIKINEKDVFFI